MKVFFGVIFAQRVIPGTQIVTTVFAEIAGRHSTRAAALASFRDSALKRYSITEGYFGHIVDASELPADWVQPCNSIFNHILRYAKSILTTATEAGAPTYRAPRNK